MCLCVFAFNISWLSATELRPWFGLVAELETRETVICEVYDSIETDAHIHKHMSYNGFLDLSVSLAPLEQWSGELELVMADTHHRSFGMDSLLFTGRYRWLNDIVDDPVSLATGLTVSKVFKPARHDPAIFHHGGIGCEAHISVGREWSCMQFWTSRIWGVCGFGVADEGSPWIRANVAWEHNWWDRHRLQVSLNTLWGLGHNRFNFPFDGYGSVRHQSVDGAVRYTFAYVEDMEFSVEYAYRLYAQNCPKGANFFLLSFYYPIKL